MAYIQGPQDVYLQVKIDKDTKEQYASYCKNHKIKMSADIKNYIYSVI